MTKQEIQKLYKQSQTKAQRYYDYYQQGGGTQYYCHYRTHDNIAWLCQQQMSNADYAADVAYFKNFIASIFNDACKCRHTCNAGDFENLAKRIIEFGENEINLKNIWR